MPCSGHCTRRPGISPEQPTELNARREGAVQWKLHAPTRIIPQEQPTELNAWWSESAVQWKLHAPIRNSQPS